MDMIVAVDENWRIGINGGMLTSIPEDMKFFRIHDKELCCGNGKKNFGELPRRKTP